MTLDLICLARYVWRSLQWKTLVKVEDKKQQINYYQSN